MSYSTYIFMVLQSSHVNYPLSLFYNCQTKRDIVIFRIEASTKQHLILNEMIYISSYTMNLEWSESRFDLNDNKHYHPVVLIPRNENQIEKYQQQEDSKSSYVSYPIQTHNQHSYSRDIFPHFINPLWTLLTSICYSNYKWELFHFFYSSATAPLNYKIFPETQTRPRRSQLKFPFIPLKSECCLNENDFCLFCAECKDMIYF